MLELHRQVIGAPPLGTRTLSVRTLRVMATERVDGDHRPDRGSSAAARAVRVERQRSLTGLEWSMAAEEHGIGVVDTDDVGVDDTDDVDRPRDTSPLALPAGDVLVTTRPDQALAIWAGDCAPVVLCGAAGTLVAAHAGWRGLAAGVIDVAVAEMQARGDHVEVAVLGPSIHAECYEFGQVDLGAVAAGVGTSVGRIGRPDGAGRSFLDVPAAVGAALERWGVELDVVGTCTSCDERWFSHRARRDDGRHAVVAWTTMDP